MSIFERIDRKISNMHAMLTRIGIDPDVFRRQRPDAMFRSSMRACQSCPNGDICSQWLKHAASRIDRVPEFCPNGRRFERVAAAMGDRGRTI
jgi:hypothetical protein